MSDKDTKMRVSKDSDNRDTDIYITVSGKTIYKAVRSYLSDSKELNKIVQETADKILTENTLFDRVEQLLMKELVKRFDTWNCQSWRAKLKEELLKDVVNGASGEIIEKCLRERLGMK